MSEESAELLESLFIETMRTVNEMADTKDLQQRRVQSEIVHNLCQSIGVFFGVMHDLAVSDDFDDFLEDEDDEE